MAYRNKIIKNPRSGQDIRFIKTAADTNGFLLEMETSWRPGSLEPALHYHPDQSEEFAVISGELSIRIDGRVRVLKAGEVLQIPPRKPHAMWNDSSAKTVASWKVWPAKDTEVFLETGMGLANDGKVNENGMPNILQVALMADKFSHIFRLAKPPYFIQKIIFALLTPMARIAGYRPVYKKYLD